jgi:Holliday junction resolvase RusA-like endonuclease
LGSSGGGGGSFGDGSGLGREDGEMRLNIPEWSITLPLCPEAKGNSRQIVRRGKAGRSMIVKSAKAQAFIGTAALIIRGSLNRSPFASDDKIGMWVMIRYPDYRRDLDVSLIMDALERGGIINNDRQIRMIEAIAEDEVGEPRVRIKLRCLGKLPWKPKTKTK